MGAALVVLSIALQACSFLCLKYASIAGGSSGAITLLAVAGVFLVGRAVVWQAALARADISKLYPATALFQVLLFLFAVLLFHETVRMQHILGLGIMLAGLTVIARARQ